MEASLERECKKKKKKTSQTSKAAEEAVTTAATNAASTVETTATTTATESRGMEDIGTGNGAHLVHVATNTRRTDGHPMGANCA